MKSNVVLVAKNLGKRFVLQERSDMTALVYMLAAIKGQLRKRTIDAVQDVNLEVRRGEIIGLIGLNGSGKSTLLRLLAGIYHPDEGKTSHKGRLVSIMGLGQGLAQRLTMRENIYLCSAMYGMSRREITKNFDRIVEFSGLKDFLDVRIFQFSSGMQQKIGFAIAIHAHADILLLDEVLSAGDASFRQKAQDAFMDWVKTDMTVIFASHQMDMLRTICSRVLWMYKGRPVGLGEPATIVDAYESFSMAVAEGSADAHSFEQACEHYRRALSDSHS